jgi:hypothetical protein
MILTGENHKTFCSATLSTTNPVCIGLGLKSGLHSLRAVSNYLSHGTALPVLCVNGRGLGEDFGGHFSITGKKYMM